jgi:hypothetical protein
MAKKKTTPEFVLCVKNDDYPASLEVRKLYRRLPDDAAKARHFVRIVDESGDDYLYPESYFHAIELPKATANVMMRAS